MNLNYEIIILKENYILEIASGVKILKDDSLVSLRLLFDSQVCLKLSRDNFSDETLQSDILLLLLLLLLKSS